jgi:hypothetical protein
MHASFCTASWLSRASRSTITPQARACHGRLRQGQASSGKQGEGERHGDRGEVEIVIRPAIRRTPLALAVSAMHPEAPADYFSPSTSHTSSRMSSVPPAGLPFHTAVSKCMGLLLTV